MADIVVPIVLENLIKLATYEANLLGGVKDQVDLLQDDLEFLNLFLQKSAGKRNVEYLRTLADQIRDVALKSEDVFDTYGARVIRQRWRNLLAKLFHCIGHARDLQSVSNRVSSIREKIDNIYKNQERPVIREAGQPSVDNEEAEQSLQRRRRYVEEDDVVGFVNDTTTLINQLTNQSNSRLEVISIHGMGGLGKTTLARKIYKDSRIKGHFNFCAWVSVSQQWQAKSLMLDLLKSFTHLPEDISKKNVEGLEGELRKQLEGKRYLIVMDDIWSTKLWDEVGVAFPDVSNGSRILITTRVGDVAWQASAPPYKLEFLDDNKSWELLQKKAFRGGQCPTNLEEPGRKLAERCRGLPLSIVLLGGILRTKEKSHRVWSRLVGNFGSYLTEGVRILTLSYNHLPQELKSCFLYLGLFPEDSEIKVKELIELWIAEGFIQSDQSTSIYDVAEDYVEKLIDRCMIQVARKRLDGGVKTCRIHDLLRDLCIAESGRDKFFDIYSIHNINVSSHSKSRRLSIQNILESHFDLPSCARSLFYFGFRKCILESVWKQIYKSTKFIRVLYLFGLRIKKIPSQIKELFFLRCLVIKECVVYDIPNSIWNFRFLETLHLQFSCLCPLPMGIWSVMKNLRYLYIAGYKGKPFHFSKHPRSLMGESFSNLQVLSCLDVDQETALVIDKFPEVRKLGLRFPEKLEECEVEKLMASIGRLKSLQSIKIRCDWATSKKVGSRLHLLPSRLTKITWDGKGTFDCNILQVLAGQPSLLVLKIVMWSQHQPPHELRFVAGGFPKLQVLKLSNVGIKTWKMEKGAMPNLESLFISDSPLMLEYLPEDELLCRSTLQLVQVKGYKKPGKLKSMLTDLKIKYPWKINIIESHSE